MPIETFDPCPDLPWLHVHPQVAKDNVEFPKVIFFLRAVDWCWHRTIAAEGDPWALDTQTEWYRAAMAAWLAGEPEIAMEIACGDEAAFIRDLLHQKVCGCGVSVSDVTS